MILGDLAVEVNVLTQSRHVHFHLISSVFLQGAHIRSAVALDPLIQCTTGTEFQLAHVIFDLAGNGDGIGFPNICCVLTLHTVALDICIVNLNGYSDIFIQFAVG